MANISISITQSGPPDCRRVNLELKWIRRFRRFTQISQTVNKAFMFEGSIAEIYQQPYLQSRCLQIVDKLCFFNAGQRRNSLDLDNYLFITQKIRLIHLVQGFAFIEYLYNRLGFVWNILIAEFPSQCFLVYRFKESATQFPMNFHRTADDLVCPFVCHILICVNLPGTCPPLLRCRRWQAGRELSRGGRVCEIPAPWNSLVTAKRIPLGCGLESL